MDKKQKKFLVDNGWEFIKNGVAIDVDQFAEVEGECFFATLKDIDYRKCNFWFKDEYASDNEDEVLGIAGYEEDKKSDC